MKQIPLTQGQVALVDDEDYEELNKFKWYADFSNQTKTFYAKRTDYSTGAPRNVKMHRVVMKAPKGLNVDHKYHNTLDNRKDNLRIVTKSQNGMNSKISKNNTSGCIGVNWHQANKNWTASICINKKQKFLGSFAEIQDAKNARSKAESKYFGEHAYINN